MPPQKSGRDRVPSFTSCSLLCPTCYSCRDEFHKRFSPPKKLPVPAGSAAKKSCVVECGRVAWTIMWMPRFLTASIKSLGYDVTDSLTGGIYYRETARVLAKDNKTGCCRDCSNSVTAWQSISQQPDDSLTADQDNASNVEGDGGQPQQQTMTRYQ